MDGEIIDIDHSEARGKFLKSLKSTYSRRPKGQRPKTTKERFKRADRLSKMEDGLYGVINDLEKEDEPTDKSEKEQLPFQQLNQDSIEKEPTTTEQMSRGVEFKKVFTSRSQLKEFLNFIKNGFKLK